MPKHIVFRSPLTAALWNIWYFTKFCSNVQ